jgi:predicted nucleic acid-binding protein
MIVIDATAAVQMSLRAGFERMAHRGLHAPALLWSEAASALRQLAWRGDVDDASARLALQRVGDAGIVHHDSAALLLAAFDLAGRLGWAKTYDAEYVALASRLNCPLLTLDGRLARTASRFVEVLDPADA